MKPEEQEKRSLAGDQTGEGAGQAPHAAGLSLEPGHELRGSVALRRWEDRANDRAPPVRADLQRSAELLDSAAHPLKADARLRLAIDLTLQNPRRDSPAEILDLDGKIAGV